MTGEARRAACLLIEESRRHRAEGSYREAAEAAVAAGRIAIGEADSELTATAFYEEGEALMFSGDHPRAIICATRGLAEAPEIPAGRSHILGKCYVLLLRASREVVGISLSTKLESADEAESWAQGTGETSFRASLLRERARILSVAERHESAFQVATEALGAAQAGIQQEGEERKCLLTLAFVAEAAGNWPAVRERCGTLLNDSSMDRWSLFDVHRLCARSARNMGDMEGAFFHARSRVELARGSGGQRFLVWALRDLYRISVAARDPLLDVAKEMVETATGLVETSPDDPILWAELGGALDDAERYEEALAAYTRAVELAPENAAYHDNVGNALYGLERYEEALAAFTRAAELAPENAAYHNRRGVALAKLERYADELAAYTRAVELAPENAVYRDNVGIALYGLERYEEALAAHTRAVELAPENAVYRDNVGNALKAFERQKQTPAAYTKETELETDIAGSLDSQ